MKTCKYPIFIRVCDKDYKNRTVCLNGIKTITAYANIGLSSPHIEFYYMDGKRIDVYMKTYEDALDVLYKIKRIQKKHK